MRINNLRWAVPFRTSQFVPRTSVRPFFTTKPTGQGTGLGLSLAYDIEKAYGGELRVESTAREGSTFIIQIPITNA